MEVKMNGIMFKLIVTTLVAFCLANGLFAQGVKSDSKVADDIDSERKSEKTDLLLPKIAADKTSLAQGPKDNPFIWLPYVLGTLGVFFMGRALLNLKKIMGSKEDLVNRLKYEDDYLELISVSSKARKSKRPLTPKEEEAFAAIADRLLTNKNEKPIHKIARDKFRDQLNEEMRKRGMTGKSKKDFTLIKGGKDPGSAEDNHS